MDNNQLLGDAGAYWSKISDNGSFSQKISWGNSPIIRKYLCKKICGKSLDSPIKALFDRAKSLYNKIDYEIAVSVGCGDASRELSLLQQNIVQKFILFEISESRIKRIYEKAEELTINNKYLSRKRNSLLYFLELGKIQHLQGEYEASNISLNAADDLMNNYRNLMEMAVGVTV